ncbi:hypothetical protein [Escherichia phage JN01]|uniref:Uncharacterized protein n=1 Tax=Escherichia phage JN01 TaxID=2692737 RepID=A0A6B9SRY2_9CAUD|nr:hypothetical protein [Escherichia phage JN01]
MVFMLNALILFVNNSVVVICKVSVESFQVFFIVAFKATCTVPIITTKMCYDTSIPIWFSYSQRCVMTSILIVYFVSFFVNHFPIPLNRLFHSRSTSLCRTFPLGVTPFKSAS